MSILDRFKGMSAVTTSSARKENPAEGKQVCLVKSVRMKENRDGAAFRVPISLKTMYAISGGNAPGEETEVCIFSGQYFKENLKRFIVAGLNIGPDNELELAKSVVPEARQAGKTEVEIVGIMWNEILPPMVCCEGEDENGQPLVAGAFDDQVCIEIETKEKEYHVKQDKKGPDDRSNWVFNAEGEPLVKTFVNTFFNTAVDGVKALERMEKEGTLNLMTKTEIASIKSVG